MKNRLDWFVTLAADHDKDLVIRQLHSHIFFGIWAFTVRSELGIVTSRSDF